MKRVIPFKYLIGILAVLGAYAAFCSRLNRKIECGLLTEYFTSKHAAKARHSAVGRPQQLRRQPIEKNRVTFASFAGNLRNRNIPKAYMPLEDIDAEISNLLRSYPDIIRREQIGTSTTLGLPIWGIKISDTAQHSEDEPRILFVGVHHAREPIGSNICLSLMRRLCAGYGKDEGITTWINSLEIWFVPVVNPDGYKYVFEHDLGFPWWRKNLRDNNGNGRFDPLYDGVDLNRNYDFNWDAGGDGKPGSWFYRGADPFSERETQAIRDLAMRENFVIGVSYHSYGESILFPWGNYEPPPDMDLIVDIATKMATRIRRESGYGTYSVLPLNGAVGQSSIWMYGHLRILDYIVEVGTEYFPAAKSVPFIIDENVKGAFFLLGRMMGAGVRGRVFDLHSQQPVLAEIKVRGYDTEYVNYRRTEPQFGTFYRLLNPGDYTLEITAEGYYKKVIPNVKVRRGLPVVVDVGLVRKNGYTY